jgi:hypothetical protein
MAASKLQAKTLRGSCNGREAVRCHPRILELRKEKKELIDEMRSLVGTFKNTKQIYPDLYWKHVEVNRTLMRVREIFLDVALAKVREDYFENAPVIEIDKQIKQLLAKADTDIENTEGGKED